MCDSSIVNETKQKMNEKDLQILLQKHSQHCVILLNYFDLKQQKISFCRSLVVHKKYTLNDLKHYIEKHVQTFIAPSDSELFQLVNQMKEYNKSQNITDSLIDLYQYPEGGVFRHCSDNKKVDAVKDSVGIYVFQLNPSHHLMSVQDESYIGRLRIYYDRILNESFAADPNALMKDIYKQLKWRNSQYIAPLLTAPLLLGYFLLSPLLTAHICCFLDDDDIKSFKMVSIGTAMICLREMRKIKIASIYMPSIIDNNLMTLRNISAAKHINYMRFHKESQVTDLCNFWCQQYKIPTSDLLICVSFMGESSINSPSETLFHLLYNTETGVLKDKYIKARCISNRYTFLLFDKRKMFQMVPHIEERHIDKVMLLNYFDFESMNLVQSNPLIVTKLCNRHDIESFIIDNVCELLPDLNLYLTIHKMKRINEKQNVFKLYTACLDKNNEIQCNPFSTSTGSRFSNMIFQINEEHDLFTMNENNNKANKQQPQPLATPSALFQQEFITFRYVSNGLTLKECARYFHRHQILRTRYFVVSASELNEDTNYERDVMIRIRPCDNGNAICKLVAARFNNEIPHSQIQLFVDSKQMKYNESLLDMGLFSWNKEDGKYRIKGSKHNCFGLNCTVLSWSIVPMRWLNTQPPDKMVMYNINVYTPCDRHLNEGYETTLPHTAHAFYVPFKKKFIVKELIDYLLAMSDGIYRERSKSLLDYRHFGDNGNVMSDKYSFVISASSGSTAELMENCYEYNAMMKYKVNIGRKISVFIVDNTRYKETKNGMNEAHPVILRFKKKAKHRQNRDDIKTYHKYIGRPMRMWVNRSDLLSKIKRSQGTPPSLVMYNGFVLSLINVQVHCFYNQISPPMSTKHLLKNDATLYQAICDKQKGKTDNLQTKIYHVLLVTLSS